jgi:hypothetical protein
MDIQSISEVLGKYYGFIKLEDAWMKQIYYNYINETCGVNSLRMQAINSAA